ncbi:MAM domain-containing protein 2a isoform X2 [Mobula birostris]|uniref:MAM domain-containing protein 2a isoform X2 n=1 Tax=Mobula birostris TaxID=1983395 RepID=UPI003B282052
MTFYFFLILHVLQFATVVQGSNGSCNFERDMCGYETEPLFGPWMVNLQGRYVHIEGSFGNTKKVGTLTSPELQALGESCVRLVYQITGSDPGRLNMYFRPEGNSFDFLLWTAKEPSDSWKIASIGVRNIAEKSKIILEGIVNPDPKASIAVFEINITPGYCIECTFEENHLCGYNNRWNPNLNWLVGGGSVRDSPLHLPTDHTLDNEQGHYMYVDSIYATHLHEVAQLMSPVTISALSGCLSFFYQLHQKHTTFFVVYTKDRIGHYEEVWRANQSTYNWNLVKVNIKASHPFQMVFEVAFSSMTEGYVALDDVSFSPHFCSNEPALLFDPSVANCNFDQNLCNYTQNHMDGKKWTRQIRKPNLFRFGDHTSGMGRYMYIEASHMRRGYNARLLSWQLRGFTGKQCLVFFYHMYGIGTGLLNVYLKKENSPEILMWKRRGEQSISWMKASIEYKCEQSHQIVFEAIRGLSINSDIAIDDILFQNGPCQDLESPLPFDAESPNEPDWYSIYI